MQRVPHDEDAASVPRADAPGLLCVGLGFRNNDRTLLAHARRDSKEGEVLAELFRDAEELPYTLKIRYPENARSGDQVEIVELLDEGWIKNLSKVEKKDE